MNAPVRVPSLTDVFLSTSPVDPMAQPLVQDLIREYDGRYGDVPGRDPAVVETASLRAGAFPAAARAFPSASPRWRGDRRRCLHARMPRRGTAEIKRVWSRRDLRRQGLAARIVVELERLALQQGYANLYLTTGSRQPEAVGLYLSLGYEPHSI